MGGEAESTAADVQNNTEASQQEQSGTESTEAGTQEGSQQEQQATEQPAGEQKAEGTETQSDKGEEQQDGGEEKAELEYADFTMPEGMEVNAEMLDKFKPLAKEFGLDQENAQKVVDLAADLVKSTIDGQTEAMKAEVESWTEKAKNDPDIGGAKFEENLQTANKALENIASPEFLGFLKETQLGNHPEMIRIFYKIGTMISEDTLIQGDKKNVAGDNFAKRHYPNSPQLKNG
jgi:hypothetical protein